MSKAYGEPAATYAVLGPAEKGLHGIPTIVLEYLVPLVQPSLRYELVRERKITRAMVAGVLPR